MEIMHTRRLPLSSLLALCLVPLIISIATIQGAQKATFSWNAGTERDLAGYRLHYGTIAEPYSEVLDVTTTSATVSNLIEGSTYVFAVTAYNAAGTESTLSSAIFYTASTGQASPPPGPAPVSLDNISSRVFVRTGDNVMIGGFIIQGDTPKKVVLRAIGPSLTAAGLNEVLEDPILELWNSTGALLASNDDWNTGSEDLTALGLAPADSRESAIVAILPAGSYSAIVHGKSTTTGIALFELYDLDRTSGSVANISTRGRVETGNGVMIGGFILGGTQATKVIVRAIGPSLVPSGLQDALLDPTLELYDSNGSLLSTNDNWRTDQQGPIIDSTIPPTDDREAAIVATLAPGAYSAIVRGKNDSTGVALFEVYALSH